MSTSEGYQRPMGLASFPPYDHPANSLFEEAVLKDASLSKLFTHRGKDSIETGGFYQTSTGRGGNLQLSVFASSLIGASHVLMKMRNATNEKAFLESVHEVIQMVRRAFDGEVVKVPVLIGFRNVALPSSLELELPFGKIKDVRPGLLQLLPYEARPSITGDKSILGFILEAEYPYKIQISDQSSSMYLTDLAKIGFNEAQTMLESIIEKVVLTFALGIKRDKPVGTSQSWILILDPLISSANISWKIMQFSAGGTIKRCGKSNKGGVSFQRAKQNLNERKRHHAEGYHEGGFVVKQNV